VRCLAHDNTQTNSPVSTQYYLQGVIIAGTPYYYVRDRLGSVTQLVSNSGTVVAQYSYDSYGNKTVVSGTLVSDIGYAGYFYHAVSGLNFTRHRAYDSIRARWLNRDPIMEMGGINLYAYVRGNPMSLIDPLGWCDEQMQMLPEILVLAYYMDAPPLPTPTGPNLAPYFASPEFTLYAPAMNAVENVVLAETALLAPEILPSALTLPPGGTVPAAALMTIMATGSDVINFGVDTLAVEGVEIETAAESAGSAIETALESGQKGLNEAWQYIQNIYGP
jgi:RHS repeat-associated protein